MVRHGEAGRHTRLCSMAADAGARWRNVPIFALPCLATPPHMVMVTAYGLKVWQAGRTARIAYQAGQPLCVRCDLGSSGGDYPRTERSRPGRHRATRGAPLLVEDNELNREVAIGLLEDAEIRVEVAENGEVAVRMIGEGDYDVVLMDMQMPVMGGIEATRIIRSDPRWRALPIIAMTANAMAADRETCLAAGMNDHVAKPIDPDELFGALQRWIKPRDVKAALMPDAAPAKKPEPQVQASDSDTPEIAGIDTRSALRRTGGNRKRYEMLLRKFAEQQADAVREIRSALAAGDASTAERAAHSLKGAAGNLGATALAESAGQAEIALKAGQNVELALDSLSRSLDAVVEAIQAALPAQASANGVGRGSIDPATVVESLTRLKKLLESDDGEAAEFIVDARPNLSGTLTGSEIESLIGLVGNFDFEAALKCLSGIAARLSLNLE